MRQPLINVTRIDTRGIEAQLKRIADAIEMYLGIIPSGPEATEDRSNPVAAYSTPDDLLREELIRLGQYTPLEEREP